MAESRLSRRQRMKNYGSHFLEHLNHLILDGFLNPISSLIKTVFFFVLLFFFFLTSLFINALQALNYLIFDKIAPNLRRQINHHLSEIIVSSMLFIFEWQCPVRFRVCFHSREAEYEFTHARTGLLLANHQFQLDLLFYYLCFDMFGHAGNIKAFAKSTLAKMPIIGKMFTYSDVIFLERSWEQDQERIEQGLNVLQSYTIPYLLAIAAEGTRFTPEKYKSSIKFAEEHGIEFRPKYHLLPRVKGFATTLRHLRKKDPNYPLFNIELISVPNPDRGTYEPTFNNVIHGRPFRVDCYIEKVNPDDLPVDPAASDEEYQKLLYKIFERKDQLVEEHKEFSGRFPQSIVHLRRYDFRRLLKFVAYNILVVGYLVFWCFHRVFWIGESVTLKVLVTSFVVAIFGAIFAVIKMSANSSYGTGQRKN